MKNFRINGKTQRVFVLKESAERVVYIPVKHLNVNDYTRMIDLEKRAGRMELMEFMADQKLDNGRNALVQFEKLIQVFRKDGDVRMVKPTEITGAVVKSEEPVVQHTPAPVQTAQPVVQQATEEPTEVKPQRRKPGPKPKAKPPQE